MAPVVTDILREVGGPGVVAVAVAVVVVVVVVVVVCVDRRSRLPVDEFGEMDWERLDWMVRETEGREGTVVTGSSRESLLGGLAWACCSSASCLAAGAEACCGGGGCGFDVDVDDEEGIDESSFEPPFFFETPHPIWVGSPKHRKRLERKKEKKCRKNFKKVQISSQKKKKKKS